MSITSLQTRKRAPIQGVRLFRVVRRGISLQETTGKNRHLPVVTFYSPPPPTNPPPTVVSATNPDPTPQPTCTQPLSPTCPTFYHPVSRKTRTPPRTVLYKPTNSTPHHSSHSTKNPPIPNFVYSAQLFHVKHIQNYYVSSP